MFALRDIAKGEYVIKYGEIIGRATEDIKKGELAHTHNVKSHLDENVEYEYKPDYPETDTYRSPKNSPKNSCSKALR